MTKRRDGEGVDQHASLEALHERLRRGSVGPRPPSGLNDRAAEDVAPVRRLALHSLVDRFSHGRLGNNHSQNDVDHYPERPGWQRPDHAGPECVER